MESEQGLTQKVTMRASRSNDPPECSDPDCNMYGKNNNKFSNYNARKKKTRCYICGDRDHEGRRCKKVTACFICSKKGHLVVDCPNKNVEVDLASRLCLKCGSIGHDMFSCVSNYDSEDLKAIECYICRKAGHLCCAGDRTILIGASCYNCGQSGHFGWECTKPNGVANGPGPFCKKLQTRGPHTRLCPREKQVKTVAEKTTERSAKRKARRARKLNTANTMPIANPNPNKPLNLNPNNPKQVKTTDFLRKQVKTAAEKTTERRAKRIARRARKLNTADPTPIVNLNPNKPKQVKTAAEKTTERRAKRKARRAHKLNMGNTTPIVNPNPNKLNGWSLLPIVGSYGGQPGSMTWIPPPSSNSPGPITNDLGPITNGPGPLTNGSSLSHSRQQPNNYQLGTQVPNSFSPRTQYPHHSYPNFLSRPQITRIPFNQETPNMAPPMVPGPSHSHQQHINYQLGSQVQNSFGPPTQFPHLSYPNFQNRPQITQIPFNKETRNMAPPMGPGPSHSHQQHINYQLGTHVSNTFDTPTQFPHHFYPNFQNRLQFTRIPFNQETRNMAPPRTEIRPLVVQPPVPPQFSHVIHNNSRQPFSHQHPWTESHVPQNSTVFPTRFPHVIQNNPRQPFINQTVTARPSMGSHNPQQHPTRPDWTF